MSRRVAVVSDVVARDAVFPIWYRYYGSLFGCENLFLITYFGQSTAFRDLVLGGLVELPTGYEDGLRQRMISSFVATLLKCFDVVIRVDVDEFLVVDPRIAPSLDAYVEEMKQPYITCRGFDVIQLEGEPPVAPGSGRTIRDRRYAYPNTALNKTCIVRTPINWSSGFHWASVFPSFGPIFMLHLKRLDVEWQMAWLRRMYDEVKDNPAVSKDIKDYYYPDRQGVERYHKGVANRPRLSGIDAWYRRELLIDFCEKIRYSEVDGIYYGGYGHEHVLCEIVEEWKTIF